MQTESVGTTKADSFATAHRIAPELVGRARAGCPHAFEAIYGAYENAIYNHLYRMVGDRERAYELTQDTFLKAFLNLPRTTPDLRVGAWLFRIATNCALDHLRHHNFFKWVPWATFVTRFHPSQVARDQPDRDVLQRENAEEVQAILDELKPTYRMALLLREYQDLSYDDMADVLSTTRAAIKSLLFRARNEFRAVLEARAARGEAAPGRVADVVPSVAARVARHDYAEAGATHTRHQAV